MIYVVYPSLLLATVVHLEVLEWNYKLNEYPFAFSEIWDALRAAAEADLTLAQAIIDSAGIIVQNPDLTICYDERGVMQFSFHFLFQFLIFQLT